jgi:low affinity Fe/Cu permease
MKHKFSKISNKVAAASGSSGAFLLAVSIIAVWLVSGPLFNFSDTWQLVINTGTTIVTFLMVFLIQNTQNRDGRAVHLKLDELLHSTKNARNEFVDLEYLDDEELAALDADFQKLLEHEISSFTSHLHNKIKDEKVRRRSSGTVQAMSDAIKKVANHPLN